MTGPVRRAPWAGPLGLHHPGSTPLHRAGPGPKLLGLAAFAVTTVVLRGPGSAVGILLVALALAGWARLPLGRLARGLAPVLVTAVLVGAYQWWAGGWRPAVEAALDLVGVVLAAVVVTSTTRSDRLLDAMARAAGPLRRVGLAPETVALAAALMLRAIPALAQTTIEVRDAARARGLERDPRALLVPAAVRTVARARATGDALAARGLGEEPARRPAAGA